MCLAAEGRRTWWREAPRGRERWWPGRSRSSRPGGPCPSGRTWRGPPRRPRAGQSHRPRCRGSTCRSFRGCRTRTWSRTRRGSTAWTWRSSPPKRVRGPARLYVCMARVLCPIGAHAEPTRGPSCADALPSLRPSLAEELHTAVRCPSIWMTGRRTNRPSVRRRFRRATSKTSPPASLPLHRVFSCLLTTDLSWRGGQRPRGPYGGYCRTGTIEQQKRRRERECVGGPARHGLHAGSSSRGPSLHLSTF